MFKSLWSKIKSKPATLLIVDDEPFIVQTIQDRLEMLGYRVITACDGQGGLHKAQTEKPDIILLDIMMPIMDGLEMLERLRAIEDCKNISVILLTANSTGRSIDRAIAYGIEEYLVKPFEMDDLLRKIKDILGRRCTITTSNASV